jgi:nucleoside 2-deoxyribosyltransferase
MRVYLAGPLGFSEAGMAFHKKSIVGALTALNHEILDPWQLTPASKIEPILQMPYGEPKRAAWAALNPEIGRNNAKAIESCDVVFAVLDGTDVDSGTASEIGYAFALGKRILGYRGDFRLSADNEGSMVNLQVEYFIRTSGGEIFKTIAELPEAIQRISTGSTASPRLVPKSANLYQFRCYQVRARKPLNAQRRWRFEPHRDCRRLFGLSYAAMAGCSSMA